MPIHSRTLLLARVLLPLALAFLFLVLYGAPRQDPSAPHRPSPFELRH